MKSNVPRFITSQHSSKINIICTYTLTNNNGSTISSVSIPPCGNLVNRDVWFFVVVPDNGEIMVQASAIGMVDGAMAAYNGSCNSLTYLDCDDDSGPGLMPYLHITGQNPGDTVWFRFWKYGGGQGTFNICATTPPLNDDCNDAIELFPDQSIIGSNFNSDYGEQPEDPSTIEFDCNGSIDNVIYYTYTTDNDGSDFDIEFSNLICVSTDGLQVGIFNPIIPCSGGSDWGNSIDCQSPWSSLDFTVSVTGPQPNTTYYILVDGWAGDQCLFDLVLTKPVMLPVELLYFKGKLLLDRVFLEWSTASEINNDYFEIQRSIDAIVWETIGKIKGHGNSVIVTYYNYTDMTFPIGMVYYRLKQVDFDGKYKYSNFVAVNILTLSEEIKIIPNPVKSGEKFTIFGIDERNKVEIFNIFGKKIETKYELQSGVYLIVIDDTKIFKLIVK